MTASNANNSQSKMSPNANNKMGGGAQTNNQKQRLARVKYIVENNDIESFRFLNLTRKEFLNMRFNYNMNLL